MPPKRAPRENEIRLTFDISKDQPFLIREMTGYEQSIAKHWIHFYRQKLQRRSCYPHEVYGEFFNKMRRKNYGAGVFTNRLDGENILFQNLFVHAPKITIAAALARLAGTTIIPTDAERKLAFMEVVALHQEKHGKDVLPTWNDFRDYAKQRLFLPKTGILALGYETLTRDHEGEGPKDVVDFYRRYYEIPGPEISLEAISRISKPTYSLEDLIENYKRVYEWIRESDPDLEDGIIPSKTDIEAFHLEQGGLPWRPYDSWITETEQRSLESIANLAGFERTKRLTVPTNRMPNGFWTEERIRERFLEAWKAPNPQGIDLSIGRLWDPPTSGELSRINKLHNRMKKENGGVLDAEACAQKTPPLPAVEVPGPKTIADSYPGGYLKLLKDIEDKHGRGMPMRFSNRTSLAGLYRSFKEKNMKPSEVPLAVSAYTPIKPKVLRR